MRMPSGAKVPPVTLVRAVERLPPPLVSTPFIQFRTHFLVPEK